MTSLNVWRIIIAVSFLVFIIGFSGIIWYGGAIAVLAFLMLLMSSMEAKLAFRVKWGMVAVASFIMMIFPVFNPFGVNYGMADLLPFPAFFLFICGAVCAMRGEPKGIDWREARAASSDTSDFFRKHREEQEQIRRQHEVAGGG